MSTTGRPIYLSAKTAIVLTCVVALAVALLTVFGAPARAATGGPAADGHRRGRWWARWARPE